MSHAVELREVQPTPLAAVRVTTRRADLPRAIVGGLDKVYASLRARSVAGLGHNVVVYRRSGWQPDDTLDVEVGVQTPAPLAADGDVIPLQTPGGPAATTLHVGPYERLGEAAGALRDWLRTNRRAYGGVDWEVYGDWTDDPAKLETQVFFLLKQALS